MGEHHMKRVHVLTWNMRIVRRSVLNPVHEVAELNSGNLEYFQSIPVKNWVSDRESAWMQDIHCTFLHKVWWHGEWMQACEHKRFAPRNWASQSSSLWNCHIAWKLAPLRGQLKGIQFVPNWLYWQLLISLSQWYNNTHDGGGACLSPAIRGFPAQIRTVSHKRKVSITILSDQNNLIEEIENFCFHLTSSLTQLWGSL